MNISCLRGVVGKTQKHGGNWRGGRARGAIYFRFRIRAGGRGEGRDATPQYL